MMMRVAAFVALAAFVDGRLLAPAHVADHTALEKPQTPQKANATHKNATVVAKKPQTDEEKLANLPQGLMAIKGLKNMFQSDKELAGGNEFAQGALSSELSNDNSAIWNTVDGMISAATEASKQMKSNASASEKAKVMDSLESKLDGKAEDLNSGLGKVNEHQQDLDEEYVLGLLIMHQKDWTVEQQLNATLTLKKNSPLLESFYDHHDVKKPLAAQLAALMDKKKAAKAAPAAKVAETKNASVVPAKTVAPKVEKAAPKAKAAKVAAKLFLQLASSFREI